MRFISKSVLDDVKMASANFRKLPVGPGQDGNTLFEQFRHNG